MNRRFASALAVLTVLLAVAALCACHPQDDSENALPESGDDDDDDDDDDGSPLVVTFLDVGLGDAAVVEVSGGVILVDGGAIGSGTDTICPYLASRGIAYLDLMVMTHPHYDHVGGLTEVFDCAAVGLVWVNGRTADETAYNAFAERLTTWGGTVEIPAQDEQLDVGTEAVATVLNTGGQYEGGDVAPMNNDSIVLAIDAAGTRVLLTADAEYDEQEDLATDYGESLQADVVKVPNHGGGPYSEAFLADAAPEIGVVSVGDNTIDLPDEDTIAAWEAVAVLYRTDRDGTVRLTWENGEWEAVTGL